MPNDARLEEGLVKTGATIIGAGPSGALCAALLASRGVEVVLVDKSEFPRTKVCGCCLSASAVQMLERNGLRDVLLQHNAKPLHTLHLYAPGNRTAAVQIAGPSYSLSREALDHALVKHAIKCGARFISGTEATVHLADRYHIDITLGGTETLRSKICIVADGIGGTSLKSESTVAANSRVGTGAISADNSVVENGEVSMCYAAHGYVGLVRLADDRVDIAAALDPQYIRDHHNVTVCVEKILRSCNHPVPGDLRDLQWKGTVALTRSRRNIAAERVFVLGDSASYVEPFTGEGIAWGLIGAWLLAPIAERAVHVWQRSQMDEWNTLYRKEIVSRQMKTTAISWLLKQEPVAMQAASLLSANPHIGNLIARFVAQPQALAER